MKHIFIIHSNLTYLAALGTICKENLDERDVLIVSRYKLGYNLPVPVHFFDFSRAYKHPWRSMWMFSPYKYIDRFIYNNIGQTFFVLYVEAMNFPAKLFFSNPYCRALCFIEEGASSHYAKVPLVRMFNDDISPILSSLRYDSIRRRLFDFIILFSGVSLKNFSLPYMPQCYYYVEGVKFYGFSCNSFKGAKEVIEISWEDIKNKFTFEKKYDLNNSVIWIGFPPQVESFQIPLKDYISCIKGKCIPHMKGCGIQKVFIKHHPVATDDVRSSEIAVFRNLGFDVEVIGDDTCIEMEILNCDNVTIYTIISGIAQYAYQMGVRKIYSVANYFPGFVEKELNDIWNYVTLI